MRARARDYQGRQWRSAARFRVGPAGTLNLARAVPVSGSYHVADAAGLLWSLRPVFTGNPATQFYMGATGFTVRLQVLAEGRVPAAAAVAFGPGCPQETDNDDSLTLGRTSTLRRCIITERWGRVTGWALPQNPSTVYTSIPNIRLGRHLTRSDRRSPSDPASARREGIAT